MTTTDARKRATEKAVEIANEALRWYTHRTPEQSYDRPGTILETEIEAFLVPNRIVEDIKKVLDAGGEVIVLVDSLARLKQVEQEITHLNPSPHYTGGLTLRIISESNVRGPHPEFLVLVRADLMPQTLLKSALGLPMGNDGMGWAIAATVPEQFAYCRAPKALRALGYRALGDVLMDPEHVDWFEPEPAVKGGHALIESTPEQWAALTVAQGQPMPASGEVRTVSATGGEKGSKPERYDLLPREGMDAVARVYGFGSTKYADHNWRKKYAWSLSLASAMRHMMAFQSGETNDPESGLPHPAHAAFHMLALCTWLAEGDEGGQFDDRYRPATTDKTQDGAA